MHLTTTFIVLSLAGFLNAGYLTYKHYQKKPLVCPINHDCNAVTNTKWGKMFGIRNEILGVFFYFGMLGSVIVSMILPEFEDKIKIFILIGLSIGLLFSALLTLIQKYIIKNFCFYCLISAGISLLLFINAIFLYNII